jgi:hypothetical protein
VLRFPLPILIPRTAPHSSSIIRGWYSRPNSSRLTKWTHCHPTSKKLKLSDSLTQSMKRSTTCEADETIPDVSWDPKFPRVIGQKTKEVASRSSVQTVQCVWLARAQNT